MRLRALSWAALVLLSVPTVASAHAHLQRSRPAAGATLHEVPRLLRLEFSEAPELAVSSVRLLDANRREITLSPLRTVAADSLRVVIADITGQLSAGRYTVRWQIAGRDGHPVHGEFEFVVGTDAAGQIPTAPVPIIQPAAASPAAPPPPVVAPGREFDAESPLFVVVRWAQFLGLLAVIGAMAFRFAVVGRVPSGDLDAATRDDATARSLRAAILGALLLAASAIARLVAQMTALREGAATGMQLEIIHVWSTWWGEIWVGHAAAAIVLIAGLLVARRTAVVGWAIAAFATLLLAFTLAGSGHAAASGSTFAMVVDALHVLAAGGWMGGLLMLVLAGLPAARSLPEAPRRAAMAALVNAFSSSALAFATLIVVTGVLAAWRNIETLGALFGSSYGRVLLLKIAALAVAAFIGLYNWRRARPVLAVTGDDRPIRSAMRAELVAGVVILLITAVLVATPIPADLVAMR